MNPQELKKLEKKVLETLNRNIKKNTTLIAGISGGPDSVFLLHFLLKLQEKKPFKTIIAHLNHQIRKKEANLDEKFVETLAEKAQIAIHLKQANIASLSKKSKKGLEETGRKTRYQFFKQLAKKYKANLILTAHHADDNLETILMNFTRGGSLQALTGMQTLENSGQINLFRPLLFISKNQILAYLKSKKIEFRLDKSNSDKKYTRNFIRHDIIPCLKKLNPNITQTITKNTKNLSEISDYLEQQAHLWLKKNTLNSQITKLSAKPFRNLHPALQKQILIQLHSRHAQATKNLESTHLQEVLTLINKNIGNKKKKFGKLTISLKSNTIQISH